MRENEEEGKLRPLGPSYQPNEGLNRTYLLYTQCIVRMLQDCCGGMRGCIKGQGPLATGAHWKSYLYSDSQTKRNNGVQFWMISPAIWAFSFWVCVDINLFYVFLSHAESIRIGWPCLWYMFQVWDEPCEYIYFYTRISLLHWSDLGVWQLSKFLRN